MLAAFFIADFCSVEPFMAFVDFQETELLEKYSGQVSVKDILEMYDNNPESYFMDEARKVATISSSSGLARIRLLLDAVKGPW